MNRVLIVDRDNYLLLALKRVLNQENYSVVSVASFQEAESVIARESFVLVITSMRRYLEETADFLVKANYMAPNVPIIAITGEDATDTTSIISSRGLKVDLLIKEPLDINRIISAMNRLVGRFQPKETALHPECSQTPAEKVHRHESAGPVGPGIPKRKKRNFAALIALPAIAFGAVCLFYFMFAGPAKQP